MSHPDDPDDPGGPGGSGGSDDPHDTDGTHDTDSTAVGSRATVHIPIGPELDLHPFRPDDIRSCVEEFVRAAAAAGVPQIRLIHGRGRGIQRGMVQDALERHPDVIEFWDDPAAHLGATYARLRRPASA